jgi:predicted DNA-binding transcriptional regulator AlpA
MKKQNAVTIGVSALPAEPILTAAQVAAKLQLPPTTIYSLTRSKCPNPIPFLKAGKFLRFRWSDIEHWLNQGRARV